MPKVGILMGSRSDLDVMREASKILDDFEVSHEMKVISAHRTPERARDYSLTAEKRGLQVIIAGAGAAAHLAGFLAAHTILPIIGVPLDGSPLKGFDALLSTVQMPGGVPVASMAIGKAGARNAALFAVQILSRGDADLVAKLNLYKQQMRAEIEAMEI
jgi:phosphoribosylaminoimidazole carboxylase PurE protein